ncbi:MAG: extracellular solute-binding protein [Candidatus Bipolaricaulis anaerobius]|jgi:multiple sugar transport system substrate-binding protein|nr:extracellular solute-binding protein [Candidatus Bipolaricaulis anaerobius]
MKRVAWIAVALLAMGAVAMAANPVKITFWTHEDPNRTPLEEEYIRRFEALYPHVTIERVTYPSAKIAEVLLTAFAAGQGPDMFNLEINDAYPYLVMGRVAPLRPEWVGYADVDTILGAYLEGTLDPVYRDGQLYGLPLELTIWSVFVNKKYFREVGLDPDTDYPRTWEQMMEVSEKLVIREGEIIKRRGFDFRYGYYLEWLLPMVEQLGGSFLSPDGQTAIINDEAWLQVLRYLQQWGPLGKNLGSPTYKAARSLFNFDRNEVTMCLSGFYQIARIRNDNPAFYESGEWMVIPFPVFENAVQDMAAHYYGHYYMVNAQSSRETQEWTWRFIAYMLSNPEEYLTKAGLIQPRNDLLASDVYAAQPFGDVFAADMARSSMVQLHVANPEFKQLLDDAVKAVMLQGVTPEDALATLRRKANEVLAEYK